MSFKMATLRPRTHHMVILTIPNLRVNVNDFQNLINILLEINKQIRDFLFIFTTLIFPSLN